MTLIQLPKLYTAVDEPPPGTVTSAELITRARITYRQLDYWCRTGLLTPIPGSRAGSGTRSHFPYAQLHRAATLQWLLTAGISLQTCRAVIDELLETGHVRIGDGLTIHLPEDI